MSNLFDSNIECNRFESINNNYSNNKLIDYHVPKLLRLIIEKRNDNMNHTKISKLKLYLDPQMLNFYVLQTLIVKGFNIECDFFLYYLQDEQSYHIHLNGTISNSNEHLESGKKYQHRLRGSSYSSPLSSHAKSRKKYLAIENDLDWQQALNYTSINNRSKLHLVIDLIDFSQLFQMSIRQQHLKSNNNINNQSIMMASNSQNNDTNNQQQQNKNLLKYNKVLSEWDIITSSDIILAQTITKTNTFILNQLEKLKQCSLQQQQQQQNDLSSNMADASSFLPMTKNLVKRKALTTATNSWLLAESIYQYLMTNDSDNNNNNQSNVIKKEPISDLWPFLDSNGRVRCQRNFRYTVFHRGLDHTLRNIGWKHLLNIYPSNYTGKERIDYIRKCSEKYYELLNEWQKNRHSDIEIKNICNMVRKDVLRTDRHHDFYYGTDNISDNEDDDFNGDEIIDNKKNQHKNDSKRINKNVKSLYNILVTYSLNHRYRYCQGMSDLASPLLYVMNDESQTYIAFCALMRRMGENFSPNGHAISRKFYNLKLLLKYYDREFYDYLKNENADELLFCYRWLLLDLKREFPFDDVFEILETIWASIPTPKYFEHNEATLNLYDEEFLYTPNRNLCDNNINSDNYNNYNSKENDKSKQKQRPKLKSMKFNANMLSTDSQTLDMPASMPSTSLPRLWDSPNSTRKTKHRNTEKSISNNPNDPHSTACSSQQLFNDLNDSLSDSSYDGDDDDDDYNNNHTRKQSSEDVSSTCSTFDSGIQRSNTITSYQDTDLNVRKDTTNRNVYSLISSSHCNGDYSDNDNVDDDEIDITTPVNDNHSSEILSNLSGDYGYLTDGHHQTQQSSSKFTNRLRSQSMNHTAKQLPKAKQLLNFIDSFSMNQQQPQQQLIPDVQIINETIDEQFNHLSAKSVSEEILNLTIKQMENSEKSEQLSAISNSSSIEILPTPSEVLIMEKQAKNLIEENSQSATDKMPSILLSPEEMDSNDAFMLFLCLTLLLQHRNHIIENRLDRNDIQMYFDNLVRKHNVRAVLQDTRILFHQYLAEWRHQHYRQQQQRQHQQQYRNYKPSTSTSSSDPERA